MIVPMMSKKNMAVFLLTNRTNPNSGSRNFIPIYNFLLALNETTATKNPNRKSFDNVRLFVSWLLFRSRLGK